MYHQYMYGSFSPVVQASGPSGGNRAPQGPKQPQSTQKDPLSGPASGLSGLLAGLRKQDLFSRFDTGDILLVLIILFLFLEGDNLELVITLGLMLLFGLEESHSPV